MNSLLEKLKSRFNDWPANCIPSSPEKLRDLSVMIPDGPRSMRVADKFAIVRMATGVRSNDLFILGED